MKLLLIRHGQTTGDIEDRYGGVYDDHLTERGREQLAATTEQLRAVKIDCIYHSPLNRARESAEIINRVLATRMKEVDGLKERDYGVLGGLMKAEAKEKYPEAVEAHTDPNNTDPDGESRVDFIARVERALAEVVGEGNESVIILAHGGSLKVMLGKLQQPIPDSIGDGEIIEVTM